VLGCDIEPRVAVGTAEAGAGVCGLQFVRHMATILTISRTNVDLWDLFIWLKSVFEFIVYLLSMMETGSSL
jgi:hypothetical protein